MIVGYIVPPPPPRRRSSLYGQHAQGPAIHPPPDWHDTLGGERWQPAPGGGWIGKLIGWLKDRGYLSDATT